MNHRLTRLLAVLAAATTIVACSSGDDDDAAAPEATVGSEQATADSAADTAAPADDTVVPTLAEVNILTDFGDVCRGVTLPGATNYDPAVAGVHPLMTMGGEDPTYEQMGSGLPDQWDPVVGSENTVELVACLARTSATETETCTGYLDDNDEDTGNTVQMYDASYDVRLIAATTGEVVAETKLDATDDVCPSFVFFDADETVKPWYAEPTDALTAFLAPHVET